MSSIRYRFLTALQVKRLYNLYIAAAPLTQPAMLESAVAAAINQKYYGQTNDVFQLAGVLAQRLILNHAFLDGNKRVALFAADMFLKINGYQLQLRPMDQDDDELNEGLSDAHIKVATQQWTWGELGRYYATIAKPLEHQAEEIKDYITGAQVH